MEDKRIEIDGEVFDLSDPDGKKAAVRAWLKAKSRERSTQGPPDPAAESAPPGAGTGQEDPACSED
jgi:hypothetical protein